VTCCDVSSDATTVVSGAVDVLRGDVWCAVQVVLRYCVILRESESNVN
jgi:hypothetical protein